MKKKYSVFTLGLAGMCILFFTIYNTAFAQNTGSSKKSLSSININPYRFIATMQFDGSDWFDAGEANFPICYKFNTTQDGNNDGVIDVEDNLENLVRYSIGDSIYGIGRTGIPGRGPDNLKPTVYFHVKRRQNYDVYEYWNYYADNDWLNDHEHDWEAYYIWVQDTTPFYIQLGNHFGVLTYTWCQIPTDNGHPYVAVDGGSHSMKISGEDGVKIRYNGVISKNSGTLFHGDGQTIPWTIYCNDTGIINVTPYVQSPDTFYQADPAYSTNGPEYTDPWPAPWLRGGWGSACIVCPPPVYLPNLGNDTVICVAGSYHWTQRADFGGTVRRDAVGFSIGSKAYIGTGDDGSRKKDFWEYDPATNVWTQKADFGGTARYGAVGFSIGAKGYIGTGDDGTNKRDFWGYDTATNTWSQKADFGGVQRSGAVGFSIGNKGYIGTGGTTSGWYPDFWEYDPATDVWIQKAYFGGTPRSDAVGFSIGNKGYIGTGYNGTNLKDFWEYSPVSNSWVQKTDFGGTARREATGFSIDTKGYIATGYDGAFKKDFWEYNPVLNTWSQKADFGGNARSFAIGFSIGSNGYIGAGKVPSFVKDFWIYASSYTLNAQTQNFNTYLWNDGSTNSSLTVYNSGVYSVEAVNACSGKFRDTINVVFSTVPVAHFNYSAVCSAVQFVNPSVNEYIWDFGDGITDSVSCPLHIYLAPGNYYVCYTAINSCGSNSFCDSIHIPVAIPQSYPVLGNDTMICNVNNYTITALAGFNTYIWNDGTTNNTLSVQSQGTYSVETVNNNGCKFRDTIHIAFDSLPQALFSYYINDSSVHFNDSSLNASEYLWNFGDGTADSAQNSVHVYSLSGAYNVCLSASNVCGSSTFCDSINIILTGIQNNRNSVYAGFHPNPFTDYTICNIEKDKIGNKLVTLKLYDAMGSLIISKNLSGEGFYELKRGNLSKGIYYYLFYMQGNIIGEGTLIAL